MIGGLFPKEVRFFDFFQESIHLIVKGAQEFRAMVDDLKHAESHARSIKDLEHKADEVTHRTVELLHKTFITPLDREDIHSLISKLDDIMDFIEAASQRIHIYGITETTDDLKALADTIVTSANVLSRCIERLPTLSKDPTQIIQDCVEVNRLENEADHILRHAMAKLFREEQDTRHLIKMKELYEILETVTDRCEDVANVIEGIVLEYA